MSLKGIKGSCRYVYNKCILQEETAAPINYPRKEDRWGQSNLPFYHHSTLSKKRGHVITFAITTI